MRYAIISDVHSNLEALTCTAREIEKRKVDRIVCLGDVVGYGANPSECLKLTSEMADEIVMGNHDRAVEDVKLRDWFHEWAREAIEWTAGVLSPEEKRQIRTLSPLIIDRKRNLV